MYLGLLLALASQAATAAPDPRIARITINDEYQLSVDRAFVERSGLIYTFRRTMPAQGQLRRVEYTNTLTCPQARAPLEAVETLALPPIDLPGVGREASSIILHGPVYQFEAFVLWPDGTNGRVTVDAGPGSAIESWFNRLSEALEGCWTTDPSGSRS